MKAAWWNLEKDGQTPSGFATIQSCTLLFVPYSYTKEEPMIEITRRIPGARKVAVCGLTVALAATMCVPGAAFAAPTSADKQAEADAALATL